MSDEISTEVETLPIPQWAAWTEMVTAWWSLILSGERQAIIGRWLIGTGLLEYQAHYPKFGTRIVHTTASLLGLGDSTLYQYRALALRVKSEAELVVVLDHLQAGGRPVQWTEVRRALLGPVGTNPTQVGPPVNQRDKIAGVLEAAVHGAEQYVEGVLQQGQQADALEIAGALIETAQTTYRLAKRISQDLPAIDADVQDVVNGPKRAEGARSEALPPWTPTRLAHFQDWIRRQPCACCGQADGVQFAHFPHSKGAGGEEWAGIPLCVEHHQELHAEGAKSWWDGWKYTVLGWYAQTIAQMWSAQ